MFGRKVSKDLDVEKVNEVTNLASKVLRVLYLLLIAAIIYVVIRLFKETKILDFVFKILEICLPLFIGILIAWLFDPFVKWLQSKKIKRTLGAVITYLIIFLVIFLVLVTLIPLLVDQVREFARIIPDVFDTVKVWGNNFFDSLESSNVVDFDKMKNEVFASLESFAKDVTTTLPQNILGFVSGLFSGLGVFGLGLIIGFFLIVNFDNSSNLFNFIPKKFRNTTVALLDEVNGSLRSYVKGAILDCSLIFVLSSLAFWAVGLQAPMLFGLFCGLTNIIPYAGPYIGGAPAVIVGLTQSPTIGILSLVVIVIIQFLEGNFLQPLIMSKTTKLHPVTIMLGLLVFGYFFGIVGMLISTPVIAALKTVFKFYDDKYGIIEKDEVIGKEDKTTV